MDIFVPAISLNTLEVKPADIDCIHWWIINNHSVGQCKKCGATKDFEKLRQELKGTHNRSGKNKSAV